MFDRVRKRLSELRSETSGNATMLVAIGVPALIGSAGLAVDTSQWYMWKRELQFAVDQAALAGAYARANTNTAVQATYVSRAIQEFNRNLSVTDDIASTPSVTLQNYNGGTNNSVVVSATVTQSLPFSSFLLGHGTTIGASAQASFTDGEQFTACIIAVDPDDSGAITISGNVSLTARCGLAALSNSSKAIVINGNPQVDPGWVISAGGIDDWFNSHTDAEVHENVSYLIDPFADLTPPTNDTVRTYTCNPATSTSTTTGTDVQTTTTNVYTGSNQNKLTLSTSTNNPGSTTVSINRPTLPGEVTGTTTFDTTVTGNVIDQGNKASPRYQRTDIVTHHKQTIVVTTVSTPAGATMLPGTYNKGVKIACNTVMQPGIYVMNGGDFETHAQYTITGNGVMIVLKNGAGIIVNGGASINLTAMTASQLMDAGVSSTNADKLAGMLIFEDRNSSGVSDNHNKLNGNASTVLNGTIYLPKSAINLSGTANVVSQCLMIAAAKIDMAGNFNMSSFCPVGMTEDTLVTTEVAGRVRLVA